MSKNIRRIALGVLCAILIACAVAVGVIFGAANKANKGLNGGVSADGAQSNAQNTAGSLGANNATDYVVSLSGNAAELATQWKAAMSLSGSVTVILKDNWTAPSGSFGTAGDTGFGSTGGLVIPANKTVVLNMNGHNINRNLTSVTTDGYVICVAAGAELIINGQGIITGGNNSAAGGGIFCNGELTLNGATISGNKTTKNGGGVRVSGAGAKFTMNAGSVNSNQFVGTPNSGIGVGAAGGVLVTISAEFCFNGGTISGNTAGWGGGVNGYDNAVINMTGGAITGNTTTDPDEGHGGGVVLLGGSVLNMTGGSISGNTSQIRGGGVYVDNSSTFNFSAGEINNNIVADPNYGGGGIINLGTVNMSGGTISGNTSAGGVINNFGVVNMSGGSIINNPNCTDAGISNPNPSSNNAVNFSGGIISGNTYGVYAPSGCTITVKGNIRITGNNNTNLSLGTNTKINFTGPLNVTGSNSSYTEACIGVTGPVNTALSTNFSTNSATPSGSANANWAKRCFFSDRQDCVLSVVSNELRLIAGSTQPVSWSAVVNGAPVAMGGEYTCYYGDIISSVTATYGSNSYTWTRGTNNNTNPNAQVWSDDYDSSATSTSVSLTDMDRIGKYTVFMWTADFIGNQKLTVTVKPRPITITIDDKQSKFGETPATLTGSVTGGTLVNGDSISSLGITYTKSPGDSVGTYLITGTATNPNYNVTFVNGEYEVTANDVYIEINDQADTYGAKFYSLKKTENNVLDDNGTPTDASDDFYNGGWRYASGSPSQFAASDLASSTRYPMQITCGGTGFTDISATSNTNYIAAGQYFINYVASPNYNITFTSNGTNGAANDQGVYEIRKADISVKSAAVFDSTNLYDSKEYNGSAHSVAIPSGAITLKGDVTASTVKYVVYKSDDTNIPATTPLATNTTFWAAATTSHTETDAATYKVYSLITAANHKDTVYVWTFKIGKSGAAFTLSLKHGTTAIAADATGAYKATYDPSKAVTAEITYTTSGVTTTNCPVLFYYKGTSTGNTYGTAADPTYQDNSGSEGTTPRNLGNSNGPKEAGTYRATVIADPSASSSYELDSSCSQSITFIIEPKAVNLPTTSPASPTYDGTAKTISYIYDKTAVTAITAADTASFTNLSEVVNGNTVNYRDLTFSSVSTSGNNTTTKFTATHAGEYAVKFTLTSTRNYKWNIADTSKETQPQIVTYTINAKAITVSLKSPAANSNTWTWNMGEVTGDVTANAPNGVISGDTVTFDVLWYEKPATGTPNAPTLEQSDVKYDDIAFTVDSLGTGVYFVWIKLSDDSAGADVNGNYKFTTQDTNFNPAEENVFAKQITVGNGSVNVSGIKWQWQLDGSGVDPEDYIKGSADPDNDTKLVYATSIAGFVFTPLDYIITADFSDVGYLELNTSKGTGGYETGTVSGKEYGNRYSDAGAYTARVYIKIKSGEDYEFVTSSSTNGYVADSKTTAYVDFTWVINKQEISFTDDSGNSLVEWAFHMSDGSNIPATNPGSEAADPSIVWTKFADGKPTFTGESVYVKISDEYLAGLGLALADLNVTYTSNSKSAANSKQTTKAVVQLKSGTATAKNYVLKSGSVPDFEWLISNAELLITGWDDEGGRDLDDGNGHVFTLPGVTVKAPDDATAKKLAENIEYKYTYTIPGGATKTDVDEDTMKADLFAIADENGTPITVTVKAVLSEDGKKDNDLAFDGGVSDTFVTQIGDSKIKIYVSLENDTSVYGDVKLNITAVYYNDNDNTNPAKNFDGQYLEVTLKTADGEYSFKLSELAGNVQYIKDAYVYELVFKVADARKETYKLAKTTFEFTVLPKPIAVPRITGEIIFEGQNIDLKTRLDANYAEYSDKEIVVWTAYDTDCRDVGKYAATLTIVNANYVWADPDEASAAIKALARYSAADEVITVSDKINANYTWEIKPYVLSGDKLWNLSGKEGASLNLPAVATALMGGENPSLEVAYSYYTDKASPALDSVEFKGGSSFYVSATLGGADAKNFVFANDTQISDKVTYKVPQSGATAFFGSALDFVKSNWLWFAIGGAILLFLILLIIIIAAAKKKKKKKAEEEAKKAEKEEAKAAAAAAAAPMLAASAAMADEKAKLEAEKAKMEAELAKAKMEAEAEAARAKAQAELDLQKAKNEAEIAKMRAEAEARTKQAQASMQQAQQVQQPAPQQAVQPVQQAMPQPRYEQPQSNVDASILAELKAELAALRAEHRMAQPQYPQPMYAPQPAQSGDVNAELRARLAEERAKSAEEKLLRSTEERAMLAEDRLLRGGYSAGQSVTPSMLSAAMPAAGNTAGAADNADVLGAVLASMVRNLASSPAASREPKKGEAPKIIEAESQPVSGNSPAAYPPDAVITTTTTVDTTNRKPATGGDRRDESIFDIDGFYDKFDENK